MAPTTIRIPKAAGTYDSQTIDPDIRSQINRVLINNGATEKIHDRLLHTLHSNNKDWTDRVQKRCQELLRSGQCTTMQECKQRILKEIRADTLADQDKEVLSGGIVSKAKTNGEAKRHGEGGESLAIPTAVVKEGVKITKECLEKVAEFPGHVPRKD